MGGGDDPRDEERLLHQGIGGVEDRKNGCERADHGQEADDLGHPREDRGDHQGRALIDVGRVKVQGHGGDAEAEPGKDEDDGQECQVILGHLRDRPGKDESQGFQVGDTSGAIKEGKTIKQKPGREDAQKENTW